MAPLRALALASLALACQLPRAAGGARLELGGSPLWRLRGSGPGSAAANAKLARAGPFAMPSLVQLDLLSAGAIPEPFDDTNLDDETLRWVHDAAQNWTYTTTFTKSQLGRGAPLFVAQGLDTIVAVRLNGALIGRSTNMHVRLALPLPPALLRDDNTLALSFGDPVAYSISQHRLHPCSCGEQGECCHFNATQYPVYSWAQGRPWVRKTQSHYGWNWGPAGMTYGVPRDLFIVSVDAQPILEDVRVSIDADRALPTERLAENVTDFKVGLELQIRAEAAVAAGTRVAVQADWAPAPVSFSLPALRPGINTIRVSMLAERPALWWPRELLQAPDLSPALYNLTISLEHAATTDPGLSLHGEFAPALRRRVGFRTVELVRDAARDGQGTLFQFRVNGQLLYVRGSNIIPFDVFTSEGRVGRAQYESILGSAASAHMSMVRVWVSLCSLAVIVLQRLPHTAAALVVAGRW